MAKRKSKCDSPLQETLHMTPCQDHVTHGGTHVTSNRHDHVTNGGDQVPHEDDPVTLKRRITLTSGISLIVGSIIGSGVFVSPGGVLQHAGSPAAALLVWGMSGVICTIGALTFCELGTMFPTSGGEYTYIRAGFGDAVAFGALWINVAVVRPAAQAVVALATAEYTLRAFAPSDCSPPRLAVIVVAAAVLAMLTALNCCSVLWSMRLQKLSTAAKLLALLLIIIAGVVVMVQEDGGHLKNAWGSGPPRLDGLALSFYSGLFAYGGWNYLNLVTEELQDPYRNLPRAIWAGLPLVGVTYVLVNAAYFVVLPADVVATSPAVAVEFGRRVIGRMQWVVPVAVAMSTLGSLNGILFTTSRLFLAGARAGHLPPALAFVDMRAHTPTPALITTCLLSFCMLGFDIMALINCLSFALWLSIGGATAALLRLRITQPHLHRPIKVPLFLPIIFLLCCAYLVLVPVITAPMTTGLGVVLTLTAVPVYLFGRLCRRSATVRRINEVVSLWIQKTFLVVPLEELPPDNPLLPSDDH